MSSLKSYKYVKCYSKKVCRECHPPKICKQNTNSSQHQKKKTQQFETTIKRKTSRINNYKQTAEQTMETTNGACPAQYTLKTATSANITSNQKKKYNTSSNIVNQNNKKTTITIALHHTFSTLNKNKASPNMIG